MAPATTTSVQVGQHSYFTSSARPLTPHSSPHSPNHPAGYRLHPLALPASRHPRHQRHLSRCRCCRRRTRRCRSRIICFRRAPHHRKQEAGFYLRLRSQLGIFSACYIHLYRGTPNCSFFGRIQLHHPRLWPDLLWQNAHHDRPRPRRRPVGPLEWHGHYTTLHCRNLLSRPGYEERTTRRLERDCQSQLYRNLQRRSHRPSQHR
jgi:hypothetical protein